MLRATHADKELIVDILSASFDTNRSVQYIVRQDGKRQQRLRTLMAYAFDQCFAFGDVFLSHDKSGCALLLFPDRKKTTFQSLLWDVKLVKDCIGVFNVAKAIRREAQIRKLHPNDPMYYLWFIGVHPDAQHRGAGTQLMKDIVIESVRINRPLYLETSVRQHLSWYERFGFGVYHELDLGYKLYFLKRNQ